MIGLLSLKSNGARRPCSKRENRREAILSGLQKTCFSFGDQQAVKRILPQNTTTGKHQLLSSQESTQQIDSVDDTIQVIDEGDLRKYRTELPNLIDDSDLSVYAYRLYGHIKRRAGANGGRCYEGARKMAEHCKMSVGKVVDAKKELAEKHLIKITPGDPKTSTPDTIRIIDIWAQNYARYRPRSPDEQGVHQQKRPRSPDEHPRSPDERKKEPLEERTKEERTHTHLRAVGAPVVVVGGSKFSLSDCRRYAEHLQASGQGINNPGGFARTIYKSGSEDELIALWLAKLEPERVESGELPAPLDTSACPDCEGRGIYYPDPVNPSKGAAKCKHPHLNQM